MPWLRLGVEGAVIVASILLAWGIEAGWDGRQERIRRSDLLGAIEVDFEKNREILDSAIVRNDDLTSRVEALLVASGRAIALSADSIGYLSEGFIGGSVNFIPALSSYEAAIGSGDIGLVQTDSLLAGFSAFEAAYDEYEMLGEIRLVNFFSGPLHELRREVGTLSIWDMPAGQLGPPDRLIPSDLNAIVHSRSFYAAVEPTYVQRWNVGWVLRRMVDATERILTAIRAQGD